MPSATQFLTFALLSLLLIAVPGPSATFVISRSLMLGRVAGVLTVVGSSAGHIPLQLLVLGAVFIVVALVGDSIWAIAAGTARSWFVRSPRRLELVGGTGSLAMIGVGIGLAFTGRKA